MIGRQIWERIVKIKGPKERKVFKEKFESLQIALPIDLWHNSFNKSRRTIQYWFIRKIISAYYEKSIKSETKYGCVWLGSEHATELTTWTFCCWLNLFLIFGQRPTDSKHSLSHPFFGNLHLLRIALAPLYTYTPLSVFPNKSFSVAHGLFLRWHLVCFPLCLVRIIC